MMVETHREGNPPPKFLSCPQRQPALPQCDNLIKRATQYPTIQLLSEGLARAPFVPSISSRKIPYSGSAVSRDLGHSPVETPVSHLFSPHPPKSVFLPSETGLFLFIDVTSVEDPAHLLSKFSFGDFPPPAFSQKYTPGGLWIF